MKISNVVISNLATFPIISDVDSALWVTLSTQEAGDVHIFIGPNGAGKSTFLDIIQQICSSVFFQVYDIKRIDTLTPSLSQDMITHIPTAIHNLHENRTWIGKPSFVSLTFSLNQKDRENMKFVYDNQKQLNELIASYSLSTFRFDFIWIEIPLREAESIVCKVQIDTKMNNSRLLDDHVNDIERFIYAYFQYFHLIQHCIAIHNALKPESEKHWHVLHATFAIIGSYRDLLHYKDTYTIWQDTQQKFSQTLQDTSISSIKIAQDHLLWLLYVQKKIASYIYKHNPHANAEEIIKILESMQLYNDINVFCHMYLSRTLVVKPVVDSPSTYIFTLVNKDANEYYLDDLSAGEKSMLGIICSVYGFHLEQWLLVVDEPELHLHPQLQKQFLILIEDLVNTFGIQCIMTTHSSLMVNENNIKHVYRFHTDKGITSIVTPALSYNEDTGKLMQILKFTNTAKIFFVKKIIMVEWETDEYAFGFYLQYLSRTYPAWRERLKDYEIVNINGKWGYARWKKFLTNFGIQSYFIWDWDNIQDTGHGAIDMHRYERAIIRHEGHGFETKSDKYKAIIWYLKTHEPSHWKAIRTTIEWLYKKWIFILQQGDIEAYLGMREKWLEETVQFFHNDFTSRIHDHHFSTQRDELERIFSLMFPE